MMMMTNEAARKTTRFTRDGDVVSYSNNGSAASAAADAAAAAVPEHDGYSGSDANIAADEAAYAAADLPHAPSILPEDAARLESMRNEMAAYDAAAVVALQALATMDAVQTRCVNCCQWVIVKWLTLVVSHMQEARLVLCSAR